MKRRLSLLAAAVVAAGVLNSARAFKGPDRPMLPDVDLRQEQVRPPAAFAPERELAATELARRVPAFQLRRDRLLRAPNFVASREGFLTGAKGEGLAVLADTARAFPEADPHRPLKAFLQEQAALFGYGPEILATTRLVRDSVSPHNGLRTVVWQQHLDGIPLFEAALKTHITRQGELVNLTTQLVPDPAAAANAVLPNRFALEAAPTLSAPQALLRAAADVGEQGLELPQITPLDAPQGAEFKARFSAAPILKGPIYAELAWLPMSDNALRLCWKLQFISGLRREMFLSLVDAQTGQVMVRRNQNRYLTNATYRVYTGDSPAPLTPGWPTPSTNQAPYVPRVSISTAAFDTNASPLGWIADADNITSGNNVDAGTDWNTDFMPDVPRVQGNPFRVFDFPLDLAQNPTNFPAASVVQLFYLLNWYHDTLYSLGFDEASGNMQNDNFGRGGLGNDAVICLTQQGGSTDNAFAMSTADGVPPTLNMLLFSGPTPYRDSTFEADVALHEFTHVITDRLLGASGILPAYIGQSGAIQEGNSDFFAMASLSEPADDLAANYPTGGWLTFDFLYPMITPAFRYNYYFGIRRYPYSTNLLTSPLTYRDIDPAQASAHPGVPITPIGLIATGAADEVHSAGEVWAVTMWELRCNLVAKLGWTNGNRYVLQLVMDGERLAPPNPNFLELRDAILQADRIDTGGANYVEVWRAFSKRGMGGSATSPIGTTCIGVVEAFDVPGLAYVGAQVDDSVTGNNNGIIDVNECFNLKIALRNSTTETLTNIFATLSTTNPGVFVVDGVSPYPSIAGGASEYNLLPFRVYTTPDFPCGAPIWFRFVHTSSIGVLSNWFVLNSGMVGALAYHFNNDRSVFIPDNNTNGVESPLTVTGVPGGLGRVMVSFFLTHSNVSDLTLKLVSPDGVAVTLAANEGAIGPGFGTNCAASARTTFDDLATDTIVASRPPYVGTFLSSQPLSAFKGKAGSALNGTWKLRVADGRAGRAGTLQCWGLSIQPIVCAEGRGGCAPDVAVLVEDKPDPAYVGLGLTYSVTVTNLRAIPAFGVQLTNLLPETVALVGVTNVLPATWTNVFTNLNGLLVFNVGTLSNFGTASFDLTVTPSVPGLLTNVFSVGGTNGDMNLTNNVASIVSDVHHRLPIILPGLATLLSDPNGSGGLESGERVGLSFALTNVGTAPTTNLLATLRSGDGVSAPSGPLAYGRLVAGGPAGAQTFFFTVTNPPGTALRLVFDLTDQGNLGTVSFDFTLGGVGQFPNLAPIIINDYALASPYPSRITVAGQTGQVNQVTVTLTRLQHYYPQDVNVLLQGPGGQTALLMAHAGYNTAVSNVTLTFDSTASASLPDTTPLLSGTFRPTALHLADSYAFPAPVPPGPYLTTLETFKTTDPNGVWSLYVFDDSKFDDGHIVGGWSLSLNTSIPVNPTADLALAMVSSTNRVLPGQPVAYRLTVTNFGPNSASAVVLSNPLPASVSFLSGSASQGTVSSVGGVVVASLGTLPARGAATIMLNLSAPQTVGRFTNFATVANTGAQQDLYLGDNTASSAVTVTSATANLAVAASYQPVLSSVAPSLALVGSNLTFTVTVTNLGPDAAYGFWITNTFLPANALRFVSATNSLGGGGVTSWAPNLTVVSEISALASGAGATVTVVVVPTNLAVLTNLVTVGLSSAIGDPLLANNQTNLVLVVSNPAPQLVIAGVVLTNDVNNSLQARKEVTAYFVLRNDGQAPASNVTATLLATNNVVPRGTVSQTYGNIFPGPAGSAVSRPFTFSNTVSSGTTLTALLRLQSGSTDLGTASITLPLASTANYGANDVLVIPDSGAANPYPSVITVPALTGSVSRITVTLSNLTHSYLHDVNVLLVGPQGGNVLLMSHVGDGFGANNVTFTFDDTAAGALPKYLSSQMTGARVTRPTAFTPAVTFPAAAPASPYGNSLTDFLGTDPSGAWSLYVFDDSGGDNGSISGWSLSFVFAAPLQALADVSVQTTLSPGSVFLGTPQTYTLTVNNAGPSPATGLVLTNLLPPGVVLLSNSLPSQGTVSKAGSVLGWSIGTLLVGESASVRLYTLPAASGRLFNTAFVRASENDPSPANNTSATLIEVSAPIAGDLVAAGSVWRYLDTGTNLGAEWTAITFEDGAWPSGPARLGYGHGDERTVVSGGDPTNRWITTYFRQPFYLTSAASYTNLVVRLLRVHGAILYLNGHELSRQNLPDGPVDYRRLAITELPANVQSLYFTTPNLDRSLLRNGTNVLAVELHQCATNGYTVGFDLQLLANTSFSNQLPSVALTGLTNRAVLPAGQTYLTAIALDPDGIVTRVEYLATNLLTSEVISIGQAAQAPYAVFWTNAPGTYTVAARAWDNSGGSSLSPAVTLTIVAPPYVLIERGTIWKYLDNGLDQGPFWPRLGFDDSIWASGQAELGFGDFPITQINGGPDTNRFTTIYFRHPFVATNGSYGNLLFELKATHGALVYLNGQEVFRGNMPTGAVGYVTLALTNTPPAEQEKFLSFYVNPTGLLTAAGQTNLLAVEVHQWSLTSSNLAFDLRLSAFPRPELFALRTNQNLMLFWPAAAVGYALESTTRLPGGTNWVPVTAPVFTSGGWSLINTGPLATNQLYFRLRRQ